MAHSFVIAGRADDVGYAEAERLGEILEAMVPVATVVKLRIHPEDWEQKRRNIGEVLGYVYGPAMRLGCPPLRPHTWAAVVVSFALRPSPACLR